MYGSYSPGLLFIMSLQVTVKKKMSEQKGNFNSAYLSICGKVAVSGKDVLCRNFEVKI